MITVNFIAVIVATIAAFIVGALWFTVLFGKEWRRLMNIPEGGMQGGMSMSSAMGGGFIATLILVFVLANFLNWAGITAIGAALTLALWLWLAVAAVMSNMIWYENRPVKLYVINAAHYLVALLVAAAIIAWWPW